MHICLVIDAELPANNYGGTERVVYWLGQALVELGHKVTFLARESKIHFAAVQKLEKTRNIESQIPSDVDIVHLHSGFQMPDNIPACQTIHGNSRHSTTFHPNSIFVSHNHAQNHGAKAFVHNGLDARSYGSVDFTSRRESFAFLAKAAWKVKNVRGAIRVASLADATIDILGGHRLNFKMGFRLTLSQHARFHGMVNDNTKAHFLNNARGLIFPVLWPEPFGVAVIESLYFGIPVFATPYGALPELVNNEVGYLSNDAKQLADAAAQWASFDRRLIHSWWQENFTAQIMAKKYLEYYTSILDGQNLHTDVISCMPVRQAKLLSWIN